MELNQEHCAAFHPDASETVAYNNPLFPVYVRYGVLSSYPDYSAISHWHEDLEFILVKKGRMTYNVNGELTELTENNGIMVNSRQLHYGFSAEHQECEFICILFSPELLRGNEWFYQNYIERITGNTGCPSVYLENRGWQSAVLKRLEKVYETFAAVSLENISYFQLVGDFLFIMDILYENIGADHPFSQKNSMELAALRNMITYMEAHFAERITLEDIALAGACCRSRCSQLFKKYLRDTPIAYVTRLRLKKSIAALLDTDAHITDIAYEYGFCGASYYCETFRKYYGVSPLQYRKSRSGQDFSDMVICDIQSSCEFGQ